MTQPELCPRSTTLRTPSPDVFHSGKKEKNSFKIKNKESIRFDYSSLLTHPILVNLSDHRSWTMIAHPSLLVAKN